MQESESQGAPTAPEGDVAYQRREPPASLWEDFIDIFYAPSRVFRRRAEGSWAGALVVLCIAALLLALIFGSAMRPVFDAEVDKAMSAAAGSADASAAQMGSMRGVFVTVMQYAAPFGLLVSVLINGFLLWLVALVLSARITLRQGFMVATYSLVPFLIQQIVMGVLAFMADPASIKGISDVGTSAAQLLADGTNPQIAALASRIEPFGLWTAVLTAIGLRVAGGMPRNKAIIAAAITWIVATAFVLLSAANNAPK